MSCQGRKKVYDELESKKIFFGYSTIYNDPELDQFAQKMTLKFLTVVVCTYQPLKAAEEIRMIRHKFKSVEFESAAAAQYAKCLRGKAQ